jgi:probable F420-dependent oxidoreductase
MDKPKFGVHIGIQEETKVDDILSLAEFIENRGFDAVFVSDSFSTYHEPLATLAMLATGSKKLSLGTCVYILPQRHPLLVAKQTAFIQRISGGRLILGIGVGWRDNEFEALGVPYNKRGLVTDEAVNILKMAWDKGYVDFSGTWFKIHEIEINTKVHTRPKLWIGGNTSRALTRAVKMGDGWVPTDFAVSDYGTFSSSLTSGLKKYERDVNDFVVASHLMLLTSNDDTKTKLMADRIATQFGSTPEEMKEWALVGTPSELVDKIVQYQNVGVTYHVLSVWGLPMDQVKEVLDVFASKVIESL